MIAITNKNRTFTENLFEKLGETITLHLIIPSDRLYTSLFEQIEKKRARFDIQVGTLRKFTIYITTLIIHSSNRSVECPNIISQQLRFFQSRKMPSTKESSGLPP
jgi:hypothetical protein